MQTCTATVRLGGKTSNTVHLTDATPAEIIVLQSIHGQDSVVDIIPTEVVRRSQQAEWDRLSRKYDAGQHVENASAEEAPTSRLARLFPGAIKRLPASFAEAGLSDFVDPERRPQHALPDDATISFVEDGEVADPVGEAMAAEASDHESEIAAALSKADAKGQKATEAA